MNSQRPFEERFWARITVLPDGCWEFSGRPNGHMGYKQIVWNGRPWQAHRAAYTFLVGPIPEGLTIDHLCRRSACVNPEHLEPVTNAENIRRGTQAEVKRALTHCKHGHEFTPENTYRLRENRRACRTCGRGNQQRYQQRLRESGRDIVRVSTRADRTEVTAAMATWLGEAWGVPPIRVATAILLATHSTSEAAA